MLTIQITFKDNSEITLKKIDSCYLGEDNLWRFFNDNDDLIIEGKLPNYVSRDGDTIYVDQTSILYISINS